MKSNPDQPWLYLITDRMAYEPRDVVDLIKEAASSGVDLIQIREKDLPVRDLCRLVECAVKIVKPYGTRILVNDRFDVALACGAQGVHLTSQSLWPDVVRKHVGDQLMIGVSTHSLEDVKQAEERGADFVVLGPVFDTPSKRMYGPPLGLAVLAQAVQHARLPVLGIGGIDLTNFRQVLACSASGIAAIRLFIESSSIKDMVRRIKEESRSVF